MYIYQDATGVYDQSNVLQLILQHRHDKFTANNNLYSLKKYVYMGVRGLEHEELKAAGNVWNARRIRWISQFNRRILKLNADDYDEEQKKSFCVHEKTFKTRCLLTLAPKMSL